MVRLKCLVPLDDVINITRGEVRVSLGLTEVNTPHGLFVILKAMVQEIETMQILLCVQHIFIVSNKKKCTCM